MRIFTGDVFIGVKQPAAFKPDTGDRAVEFRNVVSKNGKGF